jgi:hypothetical protein
VSFHFYDHWRRRSPDGIALGMARELGGEKYADSRFRKSRWARLAQDIQSRLKPRTMRVLGDPQLSFKRVIASWGYISQFPGITLAARADTDLFVYGEAREREVVDICWI